VAILAIASPRLLGFGDHGRPDRGCCPLRDGLEPEWWLRRGHEVFVQLLDHTGSPGRIEVPAQYGLDAARMHGRRPDTPRPMSAVELDREEDIRGLGTAVTDERVVR